MLRSLRAVALAVLLGALIAVHPVAAQPSDPEVISYQEQAHRSLGNYANAVERSAAITKQYWAIYQLDPQRFLYAKAAAVASSQVGAYLKWGHLPPAILTLGAARGDAMRMQSILADGNIAIYEDIAWTFLAYAKGGMRLIERAHRDGAIADRTYEAFRLIDSNEPTAAARLFVVREQADIIQPILDRNRDFIDRQSSMPSLNFGGMFRAYSYYAGYPKYPIGESFGNGEVRLSWAQQGLDWATRLTDEKIINKFLPAPPGGSVATPKTPLSPPGDTAGNDVSSLVSPLLRNGLPDSGTGGVDFSAVELRYLAERPDIDGTAIAVAFRGGQPAGQAGGVAEVGTRTAREAFLTWLALSPDKFWVNLRPDEPDRVVDQELGRTAAGRIMLEADFQMKKTVATLIHPDSPTGHAFWDALDANNGLGQQLCFSFRQWIVPGNIQIWADDESLYILNAPLDVKLESEYLRDRGNEAGCSDTGSGKQAEQLFRSTILPRVVEAVNQAPEYGQLRTIFTTRIAAEWYRTTHRAKAREFSAVIDRGRAEGWYTTDGWTPRTVFDSYVKSVNEGEFNVERRTVDGNIIHTHTYFYGGVDLMRIEPTSVTDEQFRSSRPAAAEELSQAVFSSEGFGDADGTWAGAIAVVAPTYAHLPATPAGSNASSAEGMRPATDHRLLFLTAGAGSALLIVAASVWLRRRSRRAQRTLPAETGYGGANQEKLPWDPF